MSEPTFEDALGDLLAHYTAADPEQVMTALECALYAMKEEHGE